MCPEVFARRAGWVLAGAFFLDSLALQLPLLACFGGRGAGPVSLCTTSDHPEAASLCVATDCPAGVDAAALLLCILDVSVADLVTAGTGAAGPALVGAALAALKVPCTPALSALGCAAVGLTPPGWAAVLALPPVLAVLIKRAAAALLPVCLIACTLLGSTAGLSAAALTGLGERWGLLAALWGLAVVSCLLTGVMPSARRLCAAELRLKEALQAGLSAMLLVMLDLLLALTEPTAELGTVLVLLLLAATECAEGPCDS